MSIPKDLQFLMGKIALVLFVLHCAEISAQPQVKSIMIQVGEEEPSGCQLLGKVKGSSKDSQKNEDDMPYMERLMTARNQLRNETLKLGGNTVHIIRSNNTGTFEIPGVDKEIIYIGNAYLCE